MLGVVVIAFCVWSLLRPADRNDTPGTQDSSTADTPVSQPDSTESSDSGVTADSAAQDESPLSAPELTLYTTDLANNIGKIGYDEQQMVGGKTRLEMYRDVLKGYNLIPYTTEAGEKITIATGHQVYVKADDTSGQQYIVSGVDPIPVEHSVPDTRMTVKLRAEDTCERVRVFTSRETLERAQDAWERGQAILAGEEPAPENCVILNGCLLDTKWEQGEDGRRYLPMTDIAEAYDEQSEFYDVEGYHEKGNIYKQLCQQRSESIVHFWRGLPARQERDAAKAHGTPVAQRNGAKTRGGGRCGVCGLRGGLG